RHPERLAPLPAQAAHEAVEHGARLLLPRLQRRADDGRQVAHVLGDEEVALHEALDGGEPAMGTIADALRDNALQVEGQALLRPSGGEMHVTAYPPEKLLAAVEELVLGLGEQARLDELALVAHAVDVLGDPEQRVEVAQAALALLDVGLDEIARGAALRDACIPLGELCLDE